MPSAYIIMYSLVPRHIPSFQCATLKSWEWAREIEIIRNTPLELSCVPGPDSVHQLPVDAPKFAIKSEYRRDTQDSDPGLNCSISDPTSTQESDPELNTSLSSANTSFDSSSE